LKKFIEISWVGFEADWIKGQRLTIETKVLTEKQLKDIEDYNNSILQ
jgi:hypothetical protein